MKNFTKPYLALLSFFLVLSFTTSAQTTVVIPGSFQTELGCQEDWMPDCDATRLTQTSPGIWEGTFYIPAGNWEYKVTHDNSWAENYGQWGVPGGANMMLILGSPVFIHFTYSVYTHIVDLSFITSMVKLAGDFQNELGCPGDWMPNCEASGLFYDQPANIWSAVYAIPTGNWEYKVTLNNSWVENYGLGGVLNGPNIPLMVTGDKKTLFRYNPITHVVTTTPVDHSVILAGSFQSELGCSGDWQPDCPSTGLAFDPVNNLWKGQLTIPPGNWEFKVVLNGTWAENYGADGIPGGANIMLNTADVSRVSFIYNPETHITSFVSEPVTVVIPGSFQNELGCAGDWDPACDNTRLTYNSQKQAWTGTFDIPAGNWEYKVAINNSWTENYGLNGVRNGENIKLDLPTAAQIEFRYDPKSNMVTLLYNTTGLCARAFYDANVNGFNDENIPVEQVTFNLSGNSSSTQVGDNQGTTCFTNLLPGLYTIQSIIPTMYKPTTPDSQMIDLTEPRTIEFGMVCLGGAGAKSQGFWMNKQGKAAFENSLYKDYILPTMYMLNLQNPDGSHFVPNTFEEVQSWLQHANAKNMAYMLSAQLATLFLNVETGMVDGSPIVYTPGIGNIGAQQDFMHVYYLIWFVANQLNPYIPGDSAKLQRQEYSKLKDLLQLVNSDMIFVQQQPCGTNSITSVKGNALLRAESKEVSTHAIVWPNPSADNFNLQLNKNVKGIVEIRVTDVNGKTVYVEKGNAEKKYQFGKSFTPGMYFVDIITANERMNIKVVKQ